MGREDSFCKRHFDVNLFVKVHSHQASAAAVATALLLAVTLGMGLEPIFQRQHQRHPV